MKKILFILLMVFIAGCEGELMEGVGGDNEEAAPTLAQKMRGIWIIGGAADIVGSTIIREIDLYDPVTDTWYPDVAVNASGSSYSPRAFPAAVYLSGKIYVMGGASNSATWTADVFVYDIAGNSWSTLSDITQARMNPSAYMHAGYIYLIGGSNAITTASVVTTHYRLNTTGSGTWTTIPPAAFTTARAGIGCYNFNGTVTVTGGRIVGGTGATGANSNHVYLSNQNTYTVMQNMPAARAGFAYSGYTGTSGSYLFLVGGAATLTTGNAYFTTVATYYDYASSFQVYTPPATASGFFTGTPHPSFLNGDNTKGIAFAAAVVSQYNGSSFSEPTLYVFGGVKNRNTITSDVHSISANESTALLPTPSYAEGVSWVGKTALPRARFGHCAVTAGQ